MQHQVYWSLPLGLYSASNNKISRSKIKLKTETITVNSNNKQIEITELRNRKKEQRAKKILVFLVPNLSIMTSFLSVVGVLYTCSDTYEGMGYLIAFTKLWT